VNLWTVGCADPRLTAPARSPMDKPGKTPCISPALPTGRRLPTSFTAPRNKTGLLRKRALGPEVELHPVAAEARGIANGDWVSIETPEGMVRTRARLNDDLDPRVVVGEHGWWQACPEIGAPGYDPFGPMGANFNLLIGSTALDPVSGTASHRSYLCEIRPAA
jgi:anaerobic selenocysteine-containing dehydrogenase